MDDQLFELFLPLTEEEKFILQGVEIKRDLYTNQPNFIIESEKFLTNGDTIVLRKHTRFIDFPRHRHNYIEVNYVFSGSLKQKVGEDEIFLKKGELLFLNQHIDHEIKACGKEDIVINFIIEPKFFEFIFTYLSNNNLMSNFIIDSLYNHTQKGQYLYYQVSEVKSIQELVKKMMYEMTEKSYLSESSMKLYMGLVMIELIKHSDKLKNSKIDTYQQSLIAEVLKCIDEQYRTITLYELAESLNQPHYSLSKQIKKATGNTFKELLQEKRLFIAKNLLEGSAMPVAEIAEFIGYDNVSYFYRIFKSKYGYTPKKIREQLANK
ncbi:AraC family transcriptional regulator [Gracilibacillus sp. Marseille-QA3620]